MARISPVLPLIGGGRTKFQPVYVGDLATAMATCLEGGGVPGAVYELGGPEVLTFRELFERTSRPMRAASRGSSRCRSGSQAMATRRGHCRTRFVSSLSIRCARSSTTIS